MSIFAFRHRVYRKFELAAFNAKIFYLKRKNVRIEVGADLSLFGSPQFQVKPDTEVRIGANCILRSKRNSNPIGVDHPVTFCTLQSQAKIVIGNSVGISGGTICARQLIEIGANTLIGANAYIFDNDFHPIDSVARAKNVESATRCAPVSIGSNVFIGARSIVLKGVTIGDNTVIGAGSVVSKSIPPNVIASGNPCRVIRVLDPKMTVAVE